MSPIYLQTYLNPSYLEALVLLKRSDGAYERRPMMVDTGAMISLLPLDLLDRLDFQLTQKEGIVIQQAGIAQQKFEAVEAMISIILEDTYGNRSPQLLLPVWFAKTNHLILGFEGVLDRCILYMDMLKTRTAWLSFEAN